MEEGEHVLRGGTGTSEVFVRRQFSAWLKYMKEESSTQKIK